MYSAPFQTAQGVGTLVGPPYDGGVVTALFDNGNANLLVQPFYDANDGEGDSVFYHIYMCDGDNDTVYYEEQIELIVENGNMVPGFSKQVLANNPQKSYYFLVVVERER